MERPAVIDLWNALHTNGGWIAAWSKAVQGLTPQQAAWKPQPQRHSIWQNLHHMTFWREYAVARQRGTAKLDDAQIQQRNWEEPAAVTDAAWAAAVARYEASHKVVGDALADPEIAHGHLAQLIGHDCYHVGQIMQLRSMQGLDPIV